MNDTMSFIVQEIQYGWELNLLMNANGIKIGPHDGRRVLMIVAFLLRRLGVPIGNVNMIPREWGATAH